MRNSRRSTDRSSRTSTRVLVGVLLAGSAGLALASDGPVETTHDGLVLVPDTQVMGVWVKPDADFSVYDRVMIEEVPVAFRRGWQVQQNRSSVNNVTSRDMQRIKDATSEMLRAAFVHELSTDGGFDVVDAPDTDVLLLRPAIVDLDVTAPDSRGTGRSYNFASSAGAATLHLELYDSVSGEILARAVDQRVASTPGDIMRMSTSVTNRSQAEGIFAAWADLLRESLDEARASRQ